MYLIYYNNSIYNSRYSLNNNSFNSLNSSDISILISINSINYLCPSLNISFLNTSHLLLLLPLFRLLLRPL